MSPQHYRKVNPLGLYEHIKWILKGIRVDRMDWIQVAHDTVAYRPLAGQGIRNKQRVQRLLCNKRINKRPFLSNGLANTFLQKQISTQ
jgi:hypothetical protein